MELGNHYISYGYRVTVTGTKVISNDQTDILSFASVYIGIDKKTCIGHAVAEMAGKGFDVTNIEADNIDHCFVAIPALYELRSIEVNDLE